jgi:glycosyltransferase involved in cell wall biosynthesis
MFNSTSTAKDTLPLVSIIVPTYNYGHFIGQMFESLFAQTFRDWECVVVDDGSTDNTREIVTGYATADKRIKYIYQPNAQQAAARNNGIRNSLGRYVQFLDADDLLEPRKLELQVKYLEEHPGIDIIYGNVRYFSSANPGERRNSMFADDRPWMPEVSGAGQEILKAVIEECIMVVNAPLLRKSLIDEIGWFDKSLFSVEDWDYWIRCAASGKKFQYADLPDTRALVRYHPTSSSQSGRRVLKSNLRLRRKINRTVIDVEARQLNRRLAVVLEGYTLAINDLKAGRLPKGMFHLIKAAIWSSAPRDRVRWLWCAAVAPFAPKQQFEEIIAAPVKHSLAAIFRHSFRGRM